MFEATFFMSKEWSYKKKKNLPNSSFAYVDPQGEGHFPYKDENGKTDEAHLNNAFSRLPQSNLSMAIKKKIHTKLVKAAKSLGKAHNKCSIPGCEGYAPDEKKSMLEDYRSFEAFRAAFSNMRKDNLETSFSADWAKWDLAHHTSGGKMHGSENGKIDAKALQHAMSKVPNSKMTAKAKKAAHDHLLNHHKQLGIAHKKCKVPGCKGYKPTQKTQLNKQSMLEDSPSFFALQNSLRATGFEEMTRRR